jgi:hypothetical protein
MAQRRQSPEHDQNAPMLLGQSTGMWPDTAVQTMSGGIPTTVGPQRGCSAALFGLTTGSALKTSSQWDTSDWPATSYLVTGISAGRSRFVGLAGLEPAPSSLSGMDGRAPCYPASSQVARLRNCSRDGVNYGPAGRRLERASRPPGRSSRWGSGRRSHWCPPASPARQSEPGRDRSRYPPSLGTAGSQPSPALPGWVRSGSPYSC